MKDPDIFFDKLEKATGLGKRQEIRPMLKELMDLRREFYSASSSIRHYDSYSQALFHALILELDEDEEDSIETAELCYAAIGTLMKAMQNAGMQPNADTVKRRLLLLHYFNDYLTDAMMTLFMSEHRDSGILEARNLAVECMEKMQLHDLCWIGEHYPETAEHDEQITVCDKSLAEGLDKENLEKDIEDAAVMHKALTAFLHAKYRSRL